MHGVVLSNFCPCCFHQMHMIETAIHDCVDVSVIVCGWRSDEAEKYWPMEDRARLLAQEMQSTCQIYKNIPETLTYDLQAEGIEDSQEYDNWRKFTNGIERSISMTSTPLCFFTDVRAWVRPLIKLNYLVRYCNYGNPESIYEILRGSGFKAGWDMVTKSFYRYYRDHELSEYKLSHKTSVTSIIRPYGQ